VSEEQGQGLQRDFKVAAMQPDVKDFAGRVESVEIVADVKPAQWEIVMRVARL
jgi:hypothetical protein